jgi:hypothetical protein
LDECTRIQGEAIPGAGRRCIMLRIEALLADFPKSSVLEDGTKVTVRPMVKQDRDKLVLFFKNISEEELYFLKDDVKSCTS